MGHPISLVASSLAHSYSGPQVPRVFFSNTQRGTSHSVSDPGYRPIVELYRHEILRHIQKPASNCEDAHCPNSRRCLSESFCGSLRRSFQPNQAQRNQRKIHYYMGRLFTNQANCEFRSRTKWPKSDTFPYRFLFDSSSNLILGCSSRSMMYIFKIKSGFVPF
jgi:hypothetical protein